ncbi:MAG: hypothetical protein BWY64_02081 [bacterium ADurb.Bin363]|nr:MAG: hypothetical protein BWY64_02081 [bacterium ADurb.Bin363]
MGELGGNSPVTSLAISDCTFRNEAERSGEDLRFSSAFGSPNFSENLSGEDLRFSSAFGSPNFSENLTEDSLWSVCNTDVLSNSPSPETD